VHVPSSAPLAVRKQFVTGIFELKYLGQSEWIPYLFSCVLLVLENLVQQLFSAIIFLVPQNQPSL
jgi:hypothetical protein